MSSTGITFSGFNSIDFNVVINALMQQSSEPLAALQRQQSAVQQQIDTYGTLSSRLSTLQSAVDALSTASDVQALSAASNDAAAVGAAATGSGVAGRYDVVVNQLARAQVTVSSNAAAALDAVVATGGTLTIGGATIDVGQTGPLTLQQLADAINGDAGAAANAAVVQTAPSEYRLVLTGRSTGTANAFTISDALTGGGALTFGPANAVDASDASLLVNNVPIASGGNVLAQAIPGVTLTLLRADPQSTVAIDVADDTSALKSKIAAFVAAYNGLVQFANDQATAASNGQPAIGRDPLLRQLRNSLRAAFSSSYASTGSALEYASRAGIEFTRSGTLEFNEETFDAAAVAGTTEIAKLFAGDSSTPGIFAAALDLVTTYTRAAGLVSSAQQVLADQLSRLGDQVAAMQERLALQRAALQQEFTAADTAMSTLNSQTGSLASFGRSLTSS
ncbi:MAG: flagellar filament capping protein FliD [Acidobacteria bacterium]|nr:flagellar filament capping protein FliD [Acidobacteriota bacterium]